MCVWEKVDPHCWSGKSGDGEKAWGCIFSGLAGPGKERGGHRGMPRSGCPFRGWPAHASRNPNQFYIMYSLSPLVVIHKGLQLFSIWSGSSSERAPCGPHKLLDLVTCPRLFLQFWQSRHVFQLPPLIPN